MIINIRDIFWHATFLLNMSTERLLWILHVECVHHWRKCHVQSFQRETGTWAAGHEAFPVNIQCFHSKWVPHLYNTVKTFSNAASFKNSFFFTPTHIFANYSRTNTEWPKTNSKFEKVTLLQIWPLTHQWPNLFLTVLPDCKKSYLEKFRNFHV